MGTAAVDHRRLATAEAAELKRKRGSGSFYLAGHTDFSTAKNIRPNGKSAKNWSPARQDSRGI
jgi:hypothetical protein